MKTTHLYPVQEKPSPRTCGTQAGIDKVASTRGSPRKRFRVHSGMGGRAVFTRKSISALLTGASLAALAATTGRATAGTTQVFTGPVVDWATNTDWLNIETGSDVGTFTNSAIIFDGFDNPDASGALGVHIQSGVTVDSFVNDGTILAVESAGPIFNNTSTPQATATGLLVSGFAPSVTNNGTLGALAWGIDIEATGNAYASAWAVGAYADFEVDTVDPNAFDFTNNGTVDVTARSLATALDGEAAASANGVGVIAEFEDRDDPVSSLIANNDSFEVEFSAEANAESGATANGWGDGILQDFEDVRDGLAVANNDGTLIVTGTTSATSNYYYAYSDVNVDGIDQEIDRDDTDFGGISAIVQATNSATLTVSGSASASVTYNAAVASADVAGIEQDAAGGATLSSAVATNTGDLSVAALASVDTKFGTYAQANAEAVGISQFVSGWNDGDRGLLAGAMADNQSSIMVSSVSSASGTYVGNYGNYPSVSYALGAGIDQGVFDAASVEARATNSASIGVLASASSQFTAGTYSAAAAFAAGVSQQVGAGTTGYASFVNSGSLMVEAQATSSFEYEGVAASMAVAGGASQGIYDVVDGVIEFENEAGASMSVLAEAESSALFAMSNAWGLGVSQGVDSEDLEGTTASLTALNNGTMTVASVATAESTYYAMAESAAVGIAQSGDAGEVDLVATNAGDLMVSATSSATAETGLLPLPGLALAANTYVGGIAQSGYGPLSASVTASNTATIGVMAQAEAAASTYAAAYNSAFGVSQYASGLDASVAFDNTGIVSVFADSTAQSDYVAVSSSRAIGLAQEAYSGFGLGSSAIVQAVNDDTIFADANASAGGLTTAQATYAAAAAGAVGLTQEAWSADSLQTQFTNNGTVAALGTASATGRVALAEASALGYGADVGDTLDGTMTLRNNKTGAIWAIAEAEATGGDVGYAEAWASGADFYGSGLFTQLDAVNKGLISATALATATGPLDSWAEAYASGVNITAWDNLSGSFKNGGNGLIVATAIASGQNSYARAIGINASSNNNGIYIKNKGVVSAYAEGAMAQATGIGLNASGMVVSALPPPPAVATIENHGDIWAGISTDGGETILRGNAINTENAWNAATILLENNSPANIFGNIVISDDDQIIVQNGTTKFDGVINPDMMLEGSLTIRSKGKLVMLNNNELEGASHAYVDTFKMGKKGTLQLNLTPDTSPGAYPTINANTANLGGKLRAQYQGTFYDDKMVYEDVVAAETRNGKFKKVVDNSVLLDTKAVYDNQNNVDLKVKRVGFGDVPGLTKNQTAAGDGIEKVYGKLPNNGPFSDIVKDLFTMDGAQYAAAMDQLAGAEYAQLMQSVLRSTGQLNASVTDRMDCSVDPNVLASGADARKGCFDPEKFQVWARVGGTWNDSDGDIEAPGYSENQTSIYVGGDYAINTNVFVGVAGGYFNSSLDFDDWGGRNGASMGYDGGQIALYGGYDDGTWYGRNILSYGFYSGDSRREFGITSAPQSLTGDYDTSVVSYYGEAGRRFQVNEHIGATPFLGLGLASAGIGSFTEKDPHGTGAALRIRGTDSNSVSTTLGLRVNGYWAGFRPEATIAWQHQFADARQTVDMSYAGAPKGANFSVVSSDPGSDALILGLGASYAVGATSVVSVRYDGTFWSGYTSQQLSARWTSKF
jgi:uncharacterized protein with beta-barrel porin domain